MLFNDIIQGNFEVYSIVTGNSLSEPMRFDEACDEEEKVANAGLGLGSANGISIRRCSVDV